MRACDGGDRVLRAKRVNLRLLCKGRNGSLPFGQGLRNGVFVAIAMCAALGPQGRSSWQPFVANNGRVMYKLGWQSNHMLHWSKDRRTHGKTAAPRTTRGNDRRKAYRPYGWEVRLSQLEAVVGTLTAVVPSADPPTAHRIEKVSTKSPEGPPDHCNHSLDRAGAYCPLAVRTRSVFGRRQIEFKSSATPIETNSATLLQEGGQPSDRCQIIPVHTH
uniref:Uncharacterized protein n=1 Tax=Trichuris muris TaxID=70415 RepID=A0A5S6R4M7_TRIMR